MGFKFSSMYHRVNDTTTHLELSTLRNTEVLNGWRRAGMAIMLCPLAYGLENRVMVDDDRLSTCKDIESFKLSAEYGPGFKAEPSVQCCSIDLSKIGVELR